MNLWCGPDAAAFVAANERGIGPRGVAGDVHGVGGAE